MTRTRRAETPWRVRRKPRHEWEDNVAMLSGDVYPGADMPVRIKQYDDISAMTVIGIIGAVVVAIGVYAYVKGTPPQQPVG
jgi:hypothetical protein